MRIHRTGLIWILDRSQQYNSTKSLPNICPAKFNLMTTGLLPYEYNKKHNKQPKK